MSKLSQSTLDAIAAAVAQALVAAQAPAVVAPKQPRAESPSQVMFRTRTAGTCPDCGRSDFRTPRGGLTHILAADGTTPCASTDARVAAFPVPAAK